MLSCLFLWQTRYSCPYHAKPCSWGWSYSPEQTWVWSEKTHHSPLCQCRRFVGVWLRRWWIIQVSHPVNYLFNVRLCKVYVCRHGTKPKFVFFHREFWTDLSNQSLNPNWALFRETDGKCSPLCRLWHMVQLWNVDHTTCISYYEYLFWRWIFIPQP